MPGPSAGPSRRSHTKSRKGCKTCKRRHIRCDETFPQCRNCTKHQVRCDYMENTSPESEGHPSPEQFPLVLTPNGESRVELWQQTGGFPHPDLQVFPQPQIQEYSKNELRLIEHLSAISNDLLIGGTSHMTIWTQKLPKFLSIASSYPYVMHALLSFSANHLAWAHGSSDTRNLHIHYGGVALRGLHEAIGAFSHANADAVLAASLLMLWQSTDWRSWSSLRAGIQSILAAMQSWNQESTFADHIAEQQLVADSLRTHRRMPSLNPTERSTVLQSAVQAVQRLQIGLAGNDLELYWANQLLMYIQRLQSLQPASTPEEQFGQLYYLRKWLSWVPITLLRRQGDQSAAMLTLAHFYATSLVLEPLFPDLGPSFCGAVSLAPLEKIISVLDMMQSTRAVDAIAIETASLLQFPRQTAYNYRIRASQMNQPGARQAASPMTTPGEIWSYPTIGNMSPAFAPSTPAPQYLTPQSASASQSPWLEVPGAHSGFGSGMQSWGMASPGFPAAGQQVEEGQMFDFGTLASTRGFRGGFVPTSVWT